MQPLWTTFQFTCRQQVYGSKKKQKGLPGLGAPHLNQVYYIAATEKPIIGITIGTEVLYTVLLICWQGASLWA